MQPLMPRLDVLRGLRCTLTSSFLVAIGLGFATLLFVVGRWLTSDFTPFERWAELQWALGMMARPILICSLVCGCAGWATRAPEGRHRFATSLAVIFLASLLAWVILTVLFAPPRATKSVEPAVGSWGWATEAEILGGPPIVSAAILGAIRARRHREE